METAPLVVRAAARELLDALDPLVEQMLQRMRAEAGEFDVQAHPELAEALRRSCEGNAREALEGLASDREPPRTPPPEAIVEARLSAQAGMPLDALLHTYRVGHATALEALLEAIEVSGLPPERRREAVRLATAYTFAYVDAVMRMVAQTYGEARDRLVHSRAQRRMQLVRDLLAGQTVDAGALGYDPRATHVALVIEGEAADAALPVIAGGLPLLAVSVGAALAWGWIAVGRDGGTTRLGERVPEGCVAGIGRAGRGHEGFRVGHQQANLALRVALRLGRPVAVYDDVSLEAQALTDERAARGFVVAELGPLVGDDARTVKLRTSLAAYLVTALNASSAAALLGVNDRTVAYRMRLVEELLGRPIAPRAAELAVAVRWHDVLGSP